MTENKIIKYFSKQTVYNELTDDENIGIIVDTETTGLSDDDEIIEICILPFSFNDKLEIGKVYKPLVQYEEPKTPLSDTIKKLTSLTDEKLNGQFFDDGKILSAFQKASIIIAHNSEFDKKKIKKRFPTLARVPWACSIQDIEWMGKKFIQAKNLDYIMFRYGFWFDHHGAEPDCRATLHCLSQILDDETKETAFQNLMKNVFSSKIKLYANNTPFSKKEKLKERGYRWDGDKKSWYTIISESNIDFEKKYLTSNVFFDIDFKFVPVGINERC